MLHRSQMSRVTFFLDDFHQVCVSNRNFTQMSHKHFSARGRLGHLHNWRVNRDTAVNSSLWT